VYLQDVEMRAKASPWRVEGRVTFESVISVALDERPE